MSDTETNIVLLPNQKLLDSADKDLSLEESFSLSDETIINSIVSMWRLMSQPGLVNLDYGVIRDMLNRYANHCYCIGVSAPVSDGVDVLLERILAHPLISSDTLGKSQAMIGITASPHFNFEYRGD